MKNIPKLLFIEKLENNHNKIRKKIIHNKKSFSQNVSTFIKSTKEISTSRQNKSLCNRTKNPILDNTNKSYKKYQNGVIYIKNKKKKDEIINYKKEILKIDLSKSIFDIAYALMIVSPLLVIHIIHIIKYLCYFHD